MYDLLLCVAIAHSPVPKDVSYYDAALPQLRIAGAQMINTMRESLRSAGARDEVMNAFQNVVSDTSVNPFAGTSTHHIHVIRPNHKLREDGGLEFIPAQMQQMLNHGFEQTRMYFEQNQLNHLYKNANPPYV